MSEMDPVQIIEDGNDEAPAAADHVHRTHETADEPDLDSDEPDLDSIEADLDAAGAALDRLADGTYWSDEVTGEPIPDHVLDSNPTARRAR